MRRPGQSLSEFCIDLLGKARENFFEVWNLARRVLIIRTAMIFGLGFTGV
jgi:hypothetical protein